jgi:hypothetical protein
MTGITRELAVKKIYRRLRSTGWNPREISALLYALGVTLQELEPVLREYGDL